MDFILEASILVKVAASVVAVLGLTFIAERASTRVAGVLTGAPVGVVVVYFFVGYDMGTDYAVASVPYGIVSFTATLFFVLTYFLASSALRWAGSVVSTLLASGVFVAVAALLAEVAFSIVGGIALTTGAAIAAMWLFRRITLVAVTRPVRITPRLLVVRGAFAALLIVGVISLGKALGPRWAGLLAGFPVTLLPTLLIIHLTYGAASTHALIRNFPLGVVSIVLYVASVAITFPTLGVFGGSLASLAISSTYLVAVIFWGSAGATAASRDPGDRG